MSGELSGATALVTGATAGIGRAVALRLAALGAEVVVHGRDARRGAEVVEEVSAAGATARFVAADLAEADDVRRLADEAGEVDVLVNNAGCLPVRGHRRDLARDVRRPYGHQRPRTASAGRAARTGYGRPRPRGHRQPQHHRRRLPPPATPGRTAPRRSRWSC